MQGHLNARRPLRLCIQLSPINMALMYVKYFHITWHNPSLGSFSSIITRAGPPQLPLLHGAINIVIDSPDTLRQSKANMVTV